MAINARRSGGGAPPKRKLKVLFLGAGASKAAGLPLTEELLRHIWPREHEGAGSWSSRRTTSAWSRELKKASLVLYPDGSADGFRPLVSEFFTLLEVMERVHAERERLALDPGILLKDLRAEIAEGLTCDVEKLRTSIAKTPHYKWLSDSARPDVIVTSNWDTLAELAALRSGLNVLLNWPKTAAGTRRPDLPEDSVVVLKLHGSIDWGRADDAQFLRRTRQWDYERIDQPIVANDRRRQHHRNDSETLLRRKTYDHPIRLDRSRLGFDEPLMATMAAGKDTFISDLHDIWDDAYWTLSRASRLDIIGYSFPPDDLELRTLLRVTTRQPAKAALSPDVRVSVCNPSPDTHDRARSFLGMNVQSSFAGAGSWKMGKKPYGR